MKLDLHHYTFDEIEVGYTESFSRTIDKALVDTFATLSGDFSPLHVDDDYAKDTSFGCCQAHGAICNAFVSGLIGMLMPGKHALCVYTQMQFRNPISVGTTVTVTGTVTRKYEALRLIDIETNITGTDGTLFATGLAKVKVRED